MVRGPRERRERWLKFSSVGSVIVGVAWIISASLMLAFGAVDEVSRGLRIAMIVAGVFVAGSGVWMLALVRKNKFFAD